MNNGINRIRALLINIGKALPFVVCALVCISYTETLFSLATGDLIVYGGYIIPHKPITWLICSVFEYNIQLLLIVTVLTFAIRTCIYNKLALLYLYANLIEKNYLSLVDLDTTLIYVICVFNIAISLIFVIKALILLKNSKL